ncbi:alpha/beta fold hydrolase [Inhella sp.]|uniref:alpha/beta fold hydrolase n=1 Tax=Inhella sp. TaxID=1921806 RepID=UPI0035AF1C48
MHIDIEPGVKLFVDVEGLGWVPEGGQLRQRPTLLLLHGGPGFDHGGFRPFFSRFTDIAQVVYYDHRSQGRSSDRPRDEWTLDRWADDVVLLCERLGIEKPIVVGQSFGGFVAQRYLARHPEHPAKVVLSSTSHHTGLARKLAAFRRLGGPLAEATAEAFWERPGPDTWAEYEIHCRHLYNTTPQPKLFETCYRWDVLFHFVGGEKRTMDLRPGLGKVRCPVLVMVGDEDPVTPPEDAMEIAAALRSAPVQFERFAGVGHGAWRDDPAAAETVLRRFFLAN